MLPLIIKEYLMSLAQKRTDTILKNVEDVIGRSLCLESVETNRTFRLFYQYYDQKYLRCCRIYLNTIAFKDFSCIIQLSCDSNRLSTLDGLKYCPNLQRLKCGWNQIKELKQLQYCPNLKQIDFQSNKLVSVEGIQQCQNLQKINLNINQMGYCSKLKEINICNNFVSQLDTLSYLSQLQTIECQFNSITSIMLIVSKCKQLRNIWCLSNDVLVDENFTRKILSRKLQN